MAEAGFVKPVPFLAREFERLCLGGVHDVVGCGGADDGNDAGGVGEEPGDGDD